MRTVTSQQGQTACEIVAELLPWYVNGTLGAADRRTVDIHCAGCDACSGALSLERGVIDAVRAPRVDTVQAPDAAWQRFEARLDKIAPRREERTAHRKWRFTGFRVVIAAQAAAIVVLAVLLVMERSIQEAPRFRTLANADDTLSVGKPLVRVAFDPAVSESAAAAIAAGAGGSIVAGPSPNNVYTIAFQPAQDGGSIEEKVTLLRRQAHVLLAEPVTLETRH